MIVARLAVLGLATRQQLADGHETVAARFQLRDDHRQSLRRVPAAPVRVEDDDRSRTHAADHRPGHGVRLLAGRRVAG